jgi:preprotein translocase subunit YajC
VQKRADEMTDAEAEGLQVGDQVRLNDLTATIVEAGSDFVAIQWDEQSVPELYTRAAMARFDRYNSGGQQ